MVARVAKRRRVRDGDGDFILKTERLRVFACVACIRVLAGDRGVRRRKTTGPLADGSRFPACNFHYQDGITFAEKTDPEVLRDATMGRQCGQTIVVEDLDDVFVRKDVQLKVLDQQKQSRHIKK